jgi:predicted NBD/HSP70 family sugar kinase
MPSGLPVSSPAPNKAPIIDEPPVQSFSELHKTPDFGLVTGKRSWLHGQTLQHRFNQSAGSDNGSAADLLDLIRRGKARTRAQLVAATGLARSTVAQRIEELIAGGLITEIGPAPSTGGRPPALLGFNSEAGVVLVADLGATHSRLAVCDLAGRPLGEKAMEMDIGEGPVTVLSRVERCLVEILQEAGRSDHEVRGVGIGVPGPVEFAAGRTVYPPIMPGWDGYPIRDRFLDRYRAPVLVDNDVNIMALGEHWMLESAPDDFLFVKVGTGIGSGLILGGVLHRGAQGAAGDMGHVQIAGVDEAICRCGNTGCLEASAGGRALAGKLANLGYQTQNSRDVVALVRAGDPRAGQAVREAGRLIGRVVASTVNLLNPAMIMIGGDMAEAGEQLIAGIREVVYRRSTALSTNRLQIVPSALGDRAGVTGAAAMVIEHVFDPRTIESSVRTIGFR